VTNSMPGFTAEASLMRRAQAYSTVESFAAPDGDGFIVPQIRCTEWTCAGNECACTRLVF